MCTGFAEVGWHPHGLALSLAWLNAILQLHVAAWAIQAISSCQRLLMNCCCMYISMALLVEGFCNVLDQGVSVRYEDP